MQPDLGIRGMRDVSRDLRTMQDAPSTDKGRGVYQRIHRQVAPRFAFELTTHNLTAER